jgi:arylsulfatase A
MNAHITIPQLAAALILAGCSRADAPKLQIPNFIVIMADDLGYGDIGCFGANDIKTPNIDMMAGEGIKFTAAYTASSICSPSRAAFLTGRYPQRMGINSVFFPESFTGLPENEITIANILKQQGYQNAVFGKWHLGHHHQYLPLQRGFDEYFGIPYSNDMTSVVYMRGNDVEEFEVDQRYTTQKFTSESLDFIERNQKGPFFMFLSYIMPHVPLYVPPEFEEKSERGLYGDIIQEIDWSVGQVLEKLQSLGLIENTLVIFTSDNGPWLVMKDHGGSSGVLRGGKMYTFEGSMRVPTVAIWKGKIEPGSVYDDPVTLMDILPTFANLAGIDLPGDRPVDGLDITPILMGEKTSGYREFMYFYKERYKGYRAGDWKIKLAHPGFRGVPGRIAIDPHPLSLFNLQDDPGENINLAETEPEKLKWMVHKMDSALNAFGTLAPSIVTSEPADQYHFDYLLDNWGPDYFKEPY